jgi:hypothetical protein
MTGRFLAIYVMLPNMAPPKKSKNVTVQLVGNPAKLKVGRVAGKSLTRTGTKKKGKYDHEALHGHEFNIAGNLMHKERIFDRKNNLYKERVVNTDTGEVIREVEHPLSDHTGHGSAKRKKPTT